MDEALGKAVAMRPKTRMAMEDTNWRCILVKIPDIGGRQRLCRAF